MSLHHTSSQLMGLTFCIQEAFEKCWAHSPLLAAARPFTRCHYRDCRTPPAHWCPRRQRQRQRVTEGAAMAPWNGPNKQKLTACWQPSICKDVSVIRCDHANSFVHFALTNFRYLSPVFLFHCLWCFMCTTVIYLFIWKSDKWRLLASLTCHNTGTQNY